MRKKLLGPGAAALLAAGLVTAGATSADAAIVTPTSHPATCPSNIVGGGTCHYWIGYSNVAGSTGNVEMIVYYHLSTSGASFETYRWCFSNSSSRSQNLLGVNEWIGTTLNVIEPNSYSFPNNGSRVCLNEGQGIWAKRYSGVTWMQFPLTNAGIPGQFDGNVGLRMD